MNHKRNSLTKLAAIALALAMGQAVQAQDTSPVRIGLLYTKQGPGAAIGEFLHRGSELAVEQAGKKVLGRPIELV